MALIKCPECGKEVSDKAIRCPHCGMPLNEVNFAVQGNPINDAGVYGGLSQSQKDKKRMPKWLLVIIVVGSLLLMGGIVLLCLSGINNGKNQPVSNSDSVVDSAFVEEPEDFVITEEFANNINNMNLDGILGFHDGYAKVNKGKKWGIIDKSGNLVLPIQYGYFWSDIEDGMVEVEKNGKKGFVDLKGNVVIPLLYDGLIVFYEGLAIGEKNGKYGYIDKAGNTVIPFQYDYAKRFREGLAWVKKNGKWGCIDKKGTIIIPFLYDLSSNFKEGLAWVVKNGNLGRVDSQGNNIIPFKKYNISVYDEWIEYDEGLVVFGGEHGQKCGFLINQGNIVIPIIYDNISFCSYNEGLIWVRKDNKSGYLDMQGNIVIPFEYDLACDFHEGLAWVNKSERWGCIDKDGSEVIPMQYEDLGDSYGFCEGLACVKKNGKYGCVDKHGNIIIEFQYDEIGKFHDGISKVKKNGKYGYVDKTGKEIVPIQYENIYAFSEGLAPVRKDRKWGYVDKHGNSTFAFTPSDTHSSTGSQNNYSWMNGEWSLSSSINDPYVGRIDIRLTLKIDTKKQTIRMTDEDGGDGYSGTYTINESQHMISCNGNCVHFDPNKKLFYEEFKGKRDYYHKKTIATGTRPLKK